MSSPASLALDPTGPRLYWADQDGIRRIGLDGRNPESVVVGDFGSGPGNVDLEIDPAGKLYWFVRSDGIFRADLDGSSQETLASIPFSPLDPAPSLALDPVRGKLYWNGQQITRANLDGSDAVGLGISGEGLEVDAEGARLYFGDGSTIAQADLDGGNVETLLPLTGFRPNAADLAFDALAARLYWAQTSVREGDGLLRVNADGSNPETLVVGEVVAVAVEPGAAASVPALGRATWLLLAALLLAAPLLARRGLQRQR